jgi:hypothetical protein
MISQYPPDYLGFLDETSKNEKTPGRRLGRAKKGKRAVKRLLFSNTIPQLPLCSPYPGPLSVLVMDNAQIHHGEEILELCNRFG